jgi:hypothetical protein
VHPADPGEQDGHGQGIEPALRGIHTLRSAPDVPQLVERRHQVAVDVAGPVRYQVVRKESNHRLVQETDSVTHLAPLNARSALEHDADGNEVRISVTTSDVANRQRTLDDRVQVSLRERVF